MVALGFICEGDCEKLIIESEAFKESLTGYNLQMIQAINAKGNGNLLPKHIGNYVAVLETAGAERIVIIADLEYDPCITEAKKRIGARPADIVIVARKQLEAWLLADTAMMRKILDDPAFSFEFPEREPVPFETIHHLMLEKRGRGIGGNKVKLCQRAINLGFSIQNAANHPNCPSAAYFINKLTTIS
jgi:hypothetical protein